MPKLKTNRGAAKRFKVTASGRVKFRAAKRNHILTKKTPKLKRQARTDNYLKQCDAPQIKRLIPKIAEKKKLTTFVETSTEAE